MKQLQKLVKQIMHGVYVGDAGLVCTVVLAFSINPQHLL